MAKKIIEISVEEKLRALYDLQYIDSRLDELRNTRGELPIEVEDLETLQTLEFKVKKKKSKIKKDKVIENEKDRTEVSRDEETNVIVQQENEIKDNKELV